MNDITPCQTPEEHVIKRRRAFLGRQKSIEYYCLRCNVSVTLDEAVASLFTEKFNGFDVEKCARGLLSNYLEENR